jgi:hypothetical protein
MKARTKGGHFESFEGRKEEKGEKTMSTLQKTTKFVLSRQGKNRKERSRPRPLPTVFFQLIGSGKAKGLNLRARAVKLLLWIAGLGPVSFLVADRVAHFFGLGCLGH